MKKNTRRPTAKPADRDQPSYHPEMADWNPACLGRVPNSKHEFRICASSPGSMATGPLIATIVVNPAFSPANAERIAELMSWAPSLWQSLQACSPHALDESCPCTEFYQALEVLWQSADRFPFHWPLPDGQEEGIYKQSTDAASQQIAEVQS